MTRLRFNGFVGALDGAHNNSTTTLTLRAAPTYNGGTALPAISSPNYAAMSILDANGVLKEIVHVTSYAGSGSLALTVVRGREGTSGAALVDGAAVVNAPTKADMDPFPPQRTPGAGDDEFDGLSSVTWSNGPTAPTTWDRDTTSPGRGYLRANGSGSAFVSVLQNVPSAPFTIVTRVNSNRRGGSNLGLGIVLGPASPTTGSKILWFGPNYNGGSQVWQRLLYNSWSTSSFVGAQTVNAFNNWDGPLWIKVVATTTTNIAIYVSTDGEIWTLVESGLNPGFTVGVMGIGMSENGTADLEGVADFFRVA